MARLLLVDASNVCCRKCLFNVGLEIESALKKRGSNGEHILWYTRYIVQYVNHSGASALKRALKASGPF